MARDAEKVALLEDVMKPLQRHYRRPDVSEMVVATPGLVFHRLKTPDRYGRVWRQAHDQALSYEYLMLALRTVTNLFTLPFDIDTNPALHTELPDGTRVCALAGNSARYSDATPTGGISICMRQRPPIEETRKREISDWKVHDDEEQWRWHRARRHEALRMTMALPSGVHEKLFEAAHLGKPMLFSGPTNSGKTTLLNRLLMEVDDDVRVITVEDTRELIVTVPNRLHIMVAREARNAAAMGMLDPEQVRNVILRSTPDAVLIGEISPSNAGLAVQMLRTGHDHFWTSIHAGSPEEALGELANLAATQESERSKSEIEEVLRSRFIVVQTQIEGGHRIIDDVSYPKGMTPDE